MESWHIWIISALALFIIEIFTTGFAVICLAFGAVAGAVSAACGGSIEMQVILFSVFAVISFLFVRPLMLKSFSKKDNKKSGVAALIGRMAVVSETIDSQKGTGRVAVDGDDWKAVSEDGTIIMTGERVEIVSINSIIVTVRREED